MATQTLLPPRMDDNELALFESFIASSERYLEFGSGGGTILACQAVKEKVTSIDSSREWQDKVIAECARIGTKHLPTLVHADIGPVGEWGFPVDDSRKSEWASYYSVRDPCDADLVLVDGRFRVASFLCAALSCSKGTVLMIHDFEREHYNPVRVIGREIARTRTMAAFVRKEDFDVWHVLEVLNAHGFDPR